mmetsp:Transcript_2959/g.5203  ORF Transcript_2959/g.5203 Transcript_2959/m.5203 type:complete len:247 (-) Transcript_2959:549-1289(-)
MGSSDNREWTHLKDDQGREYIVHSETQETKWLWNTFVDNVSKRSYRHNVLTGETQWLDADPNHSNLATHTNAPSERIYTAKDGRKYAYDEITRKTRWLDLHGSTSSMDSDEAAGVLCRVFSAFRARVIFQKLQYLAYKVRDIAKEIDIESLTKQSEKLFNVGSISKGSKEHKELELLHQKLVIASECVTQGTIGVDEVTTDGNHLVRARRKAAVKTLLDLGERTDAIRTKTFEIMQGITNTNSNSS